MSLEVENLYRSTPRKVRKYVERCLARGVVPFIRSSPGLGKSSIVKSIAKDFNLKVIDQRISTSNPVDFSGLPEFAEKVGRRVATFSQFDIFPTIDTPLPLDDNGKVMEGWVLFLDEFNSGTKLVLAAAYKLILDRMVGQERIHPRCVIVCAGNLDTDRAITTQIGSALESRVAHIEMMVDFDEWLEDVAIKDKWDFRIIAYLSQYKNQLMDFKPDHGNKTFCCPRTWEFVNTLYKGDEIDDDDSTLIAGTITPESAVSFVQFSKTVTDMVLIPEILKDPKAARIPQDRLVQWATISAMLQHISDDNFDDFCTYVNRYTMDYRVLFYRAMFITHGHLRHHPAYGKSAVEMARYLNG